MISSEAPLMPFSVMNPDFSRRLKERFQAVRSGRMTSPLKRCGHRKRSERVAWRKRCIFLFVCASEANYGKRSSSSFFTKIDRHKDPLHEFYWKILWSFAKTLIKKAVGTINNEMYWLWLIWYVIGLYDAFCFIISPYEWHYITLPFGLLLLSVKFNM